MGLAGEVAVKFRVGDQEVEEGAASVQRLPDGSLRLTMAGRTVTAWVVGDEVWIEGRVRRVAVSVGEVRKVVGSVTPPMPGAVTNVFVKPGDVVAQGDKLLAMSAMKLETVLRSPRDGVVRVVHAVPGQQVKPGQVLVEFE